MTHHMTFSVYAEHLSPINLDLLVLDWLFTILKAPNPTSQPARSEQNLAMFKNSHPASSMAWFLACRNPHQNPLFDGKDELAGATPTKSSDRRISASVVIRTFIPAFVLVVASLAASGSANSSVIRYSKDDLQRIIKTIFEARPLSLSVFVPVPAPVVTAAPHYEGPCERPLKAWFPDIYWCKTHLECYNFF